MKCVQDNRSREGVSIALYGIVDGARNEKIFPLVKSTREHVCLFAGKLDPAIEKTAPWLVEIDDDSDLMAAWRDVGWADNWGILCRSKGPIKSVRKHFRKFLQVMLPAGDVVLFRFYDPRVWNTYLPTCNEKELNQWFSGIDEYRAPTADGQGAINYLFQSGQLITQT